MQPNKQNIVSAQVVIKNTSRSEAGRAVEAFKNAGFEVGALVGANFSITGPVSLFKPGLQDGIPSEGDSKGESRSIASALAAVDPEIRDMIETIVVAEGNHEWFR